MSKDDTIELDFGDVKELGPRSPRVPEGDYLLRVEKVEQDTSKAGNPMWVVHSVYVDGEFAGKPAPREYLALTEKALFKVFSWVQAVKGQRIPKRKLKLPNTTPTLTKAFGGKVYGAHIADGDPRVDDEGNEKVYSEVKWHLFAREVQEKRQQKAQSAEDVTASTPEPEDDEEPDTAAEETADESDEEQSEGGDVADQLESFNLDDL